METNQVVNLNALKPHEVGIITKLNVNKELENRLMALGLRIGKEVELVRKAIFAGPIHIRVGTTEVMLRRVDAKNIEIKPLEVISQPIKRQKVSTTSPSQVVNDMLPTFNNPTISTHH